MATNSSNEIINTVGKWFEKVPSLPNNIREVLAKIAPILALVFGVLGVLGGLVGLGLLTFLAPFAVGMVYGYGVGMISAAVSIMTSALMLLAVPGLFAKKANGWTILFWVEALSVVGSVIANPSASGIIGAVIGGAIGFYLLFQIRPYYK